MYQLECGVCAVAGEPPWTQPPISHLMALSPPPMCVCEYCVSQIVDFLVLYELAEEQPFLSLFQGMVKESKDPEYWFLGSRHNVGPRVINHKRFKKA